MRKCLQEYESMIMAINTAIVLSSMTLAVIIVIAVALLRRGSITAGCVAWLMAGVVCAQVHAVVLLGPRWGVDMGAIYLWRAPRNLIQSL